MKNMGEQIPLRLSKSERLRNVKQIDFLFKNSTAIKAYPLIFTYIFPEKVQQSQIQFLFSAPKRNFKRAVDRNRIKRVLRDRVRLCKPEFLEVLKQKHIQAAFIFTGKELPDYLQIDASLKRIIQKLNDKTGA
jgi:ribonuclease P protein component